MTAGIAELARNGPRQMEITTCDVPAGDLPGRRKRSGTQASDQAGSAGPFVFGAKHRNRRFGRIRIRRNAMSEKVFRGFFHLDVACERSDDRLLEALRSHLV